MIIYFVRHGHPDYENDCLTALGRLQADAASKCLRQSGITELYSSTSGRAYQTAEYTARALGLDIIKCDFLREIKWGSIDERPLIAKGQPWSTVDEMVSRGESLTCADWYEREPFYRNTLVDGVATVAAGIDAWLKTLGYTREGEFYRVEKNTQKTVAVFSHAGSSTAAIAHMFNIPFPQLCAVSRPDFTSITKVFFSDKCGVLVTPVFHLMNDTRHIEDIMVDNVYEC